VPSVVLVVFLLWVAAKGVLAGGSSAGQG